MQYTNYFEQNNDTIIRMNAILSNYAMLTSGFISTKMSISLDSFCSFRATEPNKQMLLFLAETHTKDTISAGYKDIFAIFTAD